MQLESGYIYHIFNQGNNRETIFFCRDNYLFFLKKIKMYITPYADILAWCLMPNHFHMMVYVRDDRERDTNLECDSKSRPKLVSYDLNKSIGILLSSYTRAINKQEKRSGSLFRKRTKAECLNCFQGLSPAYFDTAFGTKINIEQLEHTYPQVCFAYIHNNPVSAGFVDSPEKWDFSSYRDYFSGRRGTLIYKKRAAEFGIL
ncbi:MAG: hypothetical protein PF481_11165 [Bacteroidales bacterium]|jgi:putative transposase|nr:hypothetical protein [Bacteroidales bacterium]